MTMDGARTAPVRGLTRSETRSVVAMAAFVLLLHLVGWGLLLVIAAQSLQLGSPGVFGVGLGVTAYALGMRHAFDADHIAAIDNTTRKLLADGRARDRPLSVGFWFSLGHSSVVFGLCVLLALGVRSLGGPIGDESSALQQTTGVVGTAVSGVFLLALGTINAVVLLGIVRVFRDMRHGRFDEVQLEEHLDNRGLLNRLLGGLTRTVRRPRHVYPVGLLFGLGFDTATEVSLLVLAAGAATFDLPWYALLVLPILFAAGMSLLDSLDGILMGLAYDWALLRPVRRVYFNMTVTGLSVVVALAIGGIEIIGLLGDEAGVGGGPIGWISGLDLDQVGYAIVALFVLTWVVALVIWRWGRIEDRWTRGLAASVERESTASHARRAG
ncbi:HoxN/HupN/NixA family nickel/cobalt transporter [Aeromicrobium sp. A1-2]|uniref:HoxN/HupN/NixA family nickel/cobalt transporter n=1 Tax=Aeromicrobium sp. A1-2 TaxID=2107713 RepID=UPI000E46A5FD|nr:HoxN/HupN/NixA family nickel/cobalt transporter [Aeromicrobium sp. A1-2]AXT83900.1 HoxN/HupN/NixA family nickel/cobalt transporter [Aeromicrobium sp. A1-2]